MSLERSLIDAVRELGLQGNPLKSHYELVTVVVVCVVSFAGVTDSFRQAVLFPLSRGAVLNRLGMFFTMKVIFPPNSNPFRSRGKPTILWFSRKNPRAADQVLGILILLIFQLVYSSAF